MSRTARFISTSLLGLALASLAWGAPPDGDAAAGSPTATVAYVPGGDAVVDAAVLRGLRRALSEVADGTGRVTLEVGRRPRAWSNAAPEAVRLVLERHARVLVAPPDRRVAHLMAQVATRIQVPLVSTSEARSVGATGSHWVVVVTRSSEADENWEAVGLRAGRRAHALLAQRR